MPLARIRCQVVEVDREDDWSPKSWSAKRSSPRDLLPWADPYIASLIQRLEQRFDDAAEANDQFDPFAADDAPFAHEEFDDGWQHDAFMPRPWEEAPVSRCIPAVYGGFPLLDDCAPTDVADAL